MKSLWFGARNYRDGYSLQREKWGLAHQRGQEFVLAGEHDSVVSLGKRAQAGSELQMAQKWFEQQGIAVESSERGGLATIHSAGQLIVYPIIHLKQRKLSVSDYIGLLMDVTQEMLAELGIAAHFRADDPGLFTAKGKIAFVGVRIDRGIALHGISLNVSNDLEFFSMIRSCGQENAAVDRVANYLDDATPFQLFRYWNTKFQLALDKDRH